MGIEWTAFSWESFATLVTGLAAVVGATIVGLKQSGIAKRQADIADRQTAVLDRQARTEELRLRSELYEKRLEIFHATSIYLATVLDAQFRPEPEIERQFERAIEHSRLLLPTCVTEELLKTQRQCLHLFALRRTEREAEEAGSSVADEKVLEREEIETTLSHMAFSLPAVLETDAWIGEPTHANNQW